MKSFVVDIEEWRSNLPGPISAALAHFGLISIHPFEDGNGRTTRPIADVLLNLTDNSADGMISVSQVIHQRLADYLQVLSESQGENFTGEVDVTEFVKFHTNALGEAAAVLEEEAVRFRRIRDGFATDMKGVLNDRQATGLMFMVDIGRISSSRFARLTMSSQPTALADLSSLVDQGLAARQMREKTRYRLSPAIVEALENAEEKVPGEQSGS